MNFFTIDNDEPNITKDDRVLFRTATEFSMFITKLAHENDDTLTTTILNYCEDRDLDPEDIAKLVSKPLKELLALEMQESGLLTKQSSAEFSFNG
jgi:hypothetical protein